MRVDLSDVMAAPGEKFPVRGEIDCGGMDPRLASPVLVDGYAESLGDTVDLNLNVSAKVATSCDRCMKPILEDVRFEMTETLKKHDELYDTDNPDVSYFEGNGVDIDDMVYRSVFMNLPAKNLCREGCCGLCPMCGADLNEACCGCVTDETDSRFDILDQLDQLKDLERGEF